MHGPENLRDPHVWWRRLVDAVIAYRCGMDELVRDYLRWIEAHRGRDLAVQAGRNVKRYAAAESWADVHEWPARGYSAQPPSTRREENVRRGRKR